MDVAVRDGEVLGGPLLVSTDAQLRHEVHRLAAAADVVPCESAAASALSRWSRAPLVLCDPAAAEEVADLAPVRRDGVWLVSSTTVDDRAWRAAVRVGACGVLVLPGDGDELRGLLGDLADAGHERGRTTGVLGACGGVGASVLAGALALVAPGRSLLVDLDPLGPGQDRVLGVEHEPGVGWEEVSASDGRLGATALRDAVPQSGSTGVLGWRGAARDGVPREVQTVVLEAAVRGHRHVVLDLPRHATVAGAPALARCDEVVLVLRPDLTGLAAAARALARLEHPGVRLVVRGRATDALEVEHVLGRRVDTCLGDQRGLAEALASGLGPVHRRGPLTRTVRHLLDHAPPEVGVAQRGRSRSRRRSGGWPW